ncbi:MAG: pyridoxal phosphate-dependent aminotransferase [Acidobacteriota bacterium]
MSLSRRALMSSVRIGRSGPPGALIAARGREALVAELGPHAGEASLIPPPKDGEIRISSNENPLGPGERVVEAIRGAFDYAGRYPTNAQPSMRDLRAVIARVNGAEPQHVVLGAGSGEILKNAAHAFTSPAGHFVSASPSYESPKRVAKYVGAATKAPPVDSQGKLDLEAMGAAAKGAGLVFVCNPNNPTSTVHSAAAIEDFVADVRKSSPDTVIHIDEAYHDYVTDPSYSTAIPLALRTPNVFVTRTFSKAYGMAGMRIGYAVGHREVIAKLGRFSLTFDTNSLGVSGAHTAIQDAAHIEQESSRNSEVKGFTLDFFKRAGFETFDSQTNFIFVKIGRPAREFREGCKEYNVLVGRDFPPLEKTYARISIGTMDEMRRAAEVFGEVLGVTTVSGARG